MSSFFPVCRRLRLGLCLALVRDRKAAFALARQNDYAPVAVH